MRRGSDPQKRSLRSGNPLPSFGSRTSPRAQEARREPGMNSSLNGNSDPCSDPLKFIALDREDLEVISTHLQDGLVRVADVLWRPQDKRLVIGLSRFDWLSAEADRPELRRCRTALRFERVSCCKCKQLDLTGKDAV